jgi:hypothetical protein
MEKFLSASNAQYDNNPTLFTTLSSFNLKSHLNPSEFIATPKRKSFSIKFMR